MVQSLWMIVLVTFMVMAAAQPQCDPRTQYERDGRCCLKCDPGTRMVTSDSCEEPQCKDCEENEYQDKYTTASKCERQEYCDPNKHFKPRVDENKKKKIPCVCKDGFHCSSQVCLTCVPHSQCPPGSGARFIGNHTHDTVCGKCPDGEFSSTNSWSDTCQKWNACKDLYVHKAGTGESDAECAGQAKNHVIAIVLVVVLAVLIVGFFVAVKVCKRQGNYKPQPYTEEKKDLKIPIHAVEEVKKPEENEDNQSLSDQTGFTANGKVVVQEMGKMEAISRQESQTGGTESFCSQNIIDLSV